MNVQVAADILYQLVMTSLTLVSPILGSAMAIGVLISMLQTITSIQDQTLAFVPKLVGVGAVILFSSHWLIRSVAEFSATMISRLPEMAP